MSDVIATVERHHAQLLADLRTRTDAVTAAVAAGREPRDELTELRAFVGGELLPHARAEEESLYPAASANAHLRSLVTGMLYEHEQLADLAGELAGSDGVRAAGAARALTEIFAGHARRENELLLPGLAADRQADLDALVVTMHERYTAARLAQS